MESFPHGRHSRCGCRPLDFENFGLESRLGGRGWGCVSSFLRARLVESYGSRNWKTKLECTSAFRLLIVIGPGSYIEFRRFLYRPGTTAVGT